MKEKINSIIFKILSDIGEDIGDNKLKRCNEHSPLFGNEKILDSLMFIRFISELEEEISALFKKNIVILDTDNLKQENSPFKTINSLSAYIEQILNK